MGDILIHPRSNSQHLFHIVGFGGICRACKSFISKCYTQKKSIFFEMGNTIKKPKSIEHDNKPIKHKNQKSTKKKNSNGDNHYLQEKNRLNLNAMKGSFRRRSCDNTMTSSPQWSPPVHRNLGPSMLSRTMSHGSSSPLMRSTSKKNAPGRASLLRTMSQINSTGTRTSSAALPRSLSRTTSRMGPIVYSNSHGLMKPPANEHHLDCTLEELCFGCVKKIKISRDAITENGDVVQEDETFTIKVSSGWRQGTKITFEDKGNQIPGADPADVIFTVMEKKHPSFTRKEDDLELKFDIPLVKALTGCTLLVPLLGGQTMGLTIDDVINPGYEKVIPGQGMPKQNEPVTRGNLIINFSVQFPKKLTDKQRSDAANILWQVC